MPLLKLLNVLLCKPQIVNKMILHLLFLDYLLKNAEGIAMSWNEEPDENINVKQGRSVRLNWFYEVGENEKFLSSKLILQQGSQTWDIAARYQGGIKYQKFEEAKNISLSVDGLNNVTLIVHRTDVGITNTYCLEVVWELANATRISKDMKCSAIFIYDLPHITHHTATLSCKQGDSVKLQCNATGFPAPLVEWIHNDSHPVILERSSDILLNITGKNTGGRYCCDAKNRFGRKAACTTVNVTEYEPEKTMILSTRTYKGNINIIHIECNAAASPPADKFIMRIDDKQFNSSNGKKYYEVHPPRKDILVSCIPCNKYGQGPLRKIILPVHAPPRFSSPLCTQYNMTIDDITMKCSATGIPKPKITWTRKETGEIVSTDEYYKMKYIKCNAERMTFVCYALNVMGNISSPEILVNVMTRENCSTSEKASNQSTINFWKNIIIILSVTVVTVILMPIIFIILKTKCGPLRKVKQTEESPYQEPVDAIIATSEQQLLDHDRRALPEEDYAAVQDYILTDIRSQQNSSTPVTDWRKEPQTVGGSEPIYEELVHTEL